MKTATVRELKARLSQYLKDAEQQDVIVTSHGRPCAVLHGLVGEELEDYLIANSPTIRKKVEKSYEDYLKEGGISLDDVMKKMKGKSAKKVRR